MSLITQINQVANGCAPDSHRPADLVVDRAEWGQLVNTHRVFNGRARHSDPLLIDLNPASQLEAGGKVLFMVTSDPKAVWPADEKMADAIESGRIKAWDVPLEDLGGKQSLVFTDKLAKELGLIIGCSFEIKQMDRAGNVSANAAKIDLVNNGSAIQKFKFAPGSKQIGDTTLTMPQYNRADNRGRNRGATTDYNFNRYTDTTPPVVHPADLSIQYDVDSKTVTLAGERAIEQKSVFHLKNLRTQESFKVTVDENGSFCHAGVDLQPGDAFSVWVQDRNGVVAKLGNTTYQPAGDCDTPCADEKKAKKKVA